MPIMFCYRCGSWTARRSRGLAKTCTGIPTAAGRQALGYINRGRHPWRPPGADESRRPAVVVGGSDLWAEPGEAEPAIAEVVGAPATTPSAASRHGGSAAQASEDTAVAVQDTPPGGPASSGDAEDAGTPMDWQRGSDDVDVEDVFGHGGSLDGEPTSAEQPPAKRPRCAHWVTASGGADDDGAGELDGGQAAVSDRNAHVLQDSGASSSSAAPASWQDRQPHGRRRPRSSPQPSTFGPPGKRGRKIQELEGGMAEGGEIQAIEGAEADAVGQVGPRAQEPGQFPRRRRPGPDPRAPDGFRHRQDGPPVARGCEEGPPRRKPRLDAARPQRASPALAQPRRGGSPTGPSGRGMGGGERE